MPRRTSTLLLAALAACGAPPGAARLPAAGTPGDDGSGLLARASVRYTTDDDEGGFEPQPGGTGYPTGYEYGYGGFTYGAFGGALYGGLGGTLYGGYVVQPSWSSPSRAPAFGSVSLSGTGAIEGVVTWPTPPRAPVELALAAGPGCERAPNDGPALGRGNTVEGAVVFLDTPGSTRGFGWGTKPMFVGGTLELDGCALVPRVQVLGPAPTTLRLFNDAGQARAFDVTRAGSSDAPVAVTLGAGGHGAAPIPARGIYRVADVDGRLPPAWIVAADHPYVTTTDARGRFVLDEVVPGEYELVAWHPPVVTGVVDGVPQHGEPVVVRRKVAVTRNAATRLTLELR